VHAVPAVQALHAPLLHTLLFPHVVPLLTGVPVSPHTGAPVEQPIVPVSH
jgi:hypothetical protein